MTATPSGNLVDIARAAGGFASFLEAAEAAELLDTLQGPGPFTLFAPTDAAFAKFPAATLSKLMQADQKPLLRSIIAFHFAEGRVAAGRFAGKKIRAKSYEGGELLVDGSSGIVVNGARVVMPDLGAVNGVLHGVDKVLWPKQREAAVAGKA
jgi:uncharacterized surface protein with fasciclin (FAS1) repeats